MIKKIKKLLFILKYFFTDEDNLLLHLLELKALQTLDSCNDLEVVNTEEIEDLLFHLHIYYEIPEGLVETKYPSFKGESVRSIIKKFKEGKLSMGEVDKYADFIIDVETQRAVERDFIFEYAKNLAFGFEL